MRALARRQLTSLVFKSFSINRAAEAQNRFRSHRYGTKFVPVNPYSSTKCVAPTLRRQKDISHCRVVRKTQLFPMRPREVGNVKLSVLGCCGCAFFSVMTSSLDKVGLSSMYPRTHPCLRKGAPLRHGTCRAKVEVSREVQHYLGTYLYTSQVVIHALKVDKRGLRCRQCPFLTRPLFYTISSSLLAHASCPCLAGNKDSGVAVHDKVEGRKPHTARQLAATPCHVRRAPARLDLLCCGASLHARQNEAQAQATRLPGSQVPGPPGRGKSRSLTVSRAGWAVYQLDIGIAIAKQALAAPYRRVCGEVADPLSIHVF